MARLVGVAGSLRKGSYNRALLRAAQGLVPPGTVLEVAAIDGIPLYDGDIEASSGIPPAVATLKDAIAGADGLLLVTPEYNNGIPGVFKNAIDWASRPPADSGRVFGGKPVAVLGASPGGFGSILAQNDWLPVLRALGTRPWHGGRLMVAQAGRVFDAEGTLVDAGIRDRLAQFLAGFAAFVDGG